MSKSSSSDFATRLTSAASRFDSETHVAGFHDNGAGGDALDHRVVGVRQAGGADHMDKSALGGDGDIGDGRSRDRKINHAVGVFRQFPEVSGQLDAVGGKPGKHAGILPQQRRAGRFQRAGQHRAVHTCEMVFTSTRPIRPPAPATIKRMSDMSSVLRNAYAIAALARAATRARRNVKCGQRRPPISCFWSWQMFRRLAALAIVLMATPAPGSRKRRRRAGIFLRRARRHALQGPR